MKVLVTGATGFVGRWLVAELEGAGHAVVAAPPSSALDIANGEAVRALVGAARPDVIAHLAAVSSRQDADLDAARSVRTMLAGTHAIVSAARSLDPPPGVLVVSSAEVYGAALGAGKPLDESVQPAPTTTYGWLKLGQEAIARQAAGTSVPLVIARPFNHIGPGQRQPSAAASFASRVRAVRNGEADAIAVGNLDVERDIADVRDVARAYRLLLEALAARRFEDAPVFNVGSGEAVSLRRILEELCRLGGVTPSVRVDPQLVRADDPVRVVADVRALERATGWRPQIPLERTLADLMASLDER